MSDYKPVAEQGVPERLERALAAEVSLASRMRYLAVGLMGGFAATLTAVLWATEPTPLPARTQVAFAGLIGIGLSWVGFTGWVLTRRKPVFARDRVLGARLALVATAVTAVAGASLAAARGTTAQAVATALVGFLFTAVGVLVLARARSRRRELLQLRNAMQEGRS